MRQLQNEPEKLRYFYQTIAQICRLTVHLLMDRLITHSNFGQSRAKSIKN